MESMLREKILELLKEVSDNNINLSSEFARSQVATDIINLMDERNWIKCNCGKPYDYTKIDSS